MMNTRRIGKFSISLNDVEDNPHVVRAIMGRCIVVRCELMYSTGDKFEYVALSEDFEEVPHGDIIPEYDVIIKVEDDGDLVHIEFKRIPYCYHATEAGCKAAGLNEKQTKRALED